jgi:hypothetical protein
MPTYAQLRVESWWGREITTSELDWLGDELCRRTKRPRGAFGNKGDNAHLRGSHRSQEWILKSRYCTSRSYTVQSGLTATQARHIAGVDFTPGSDSQMIAQCKRIYAAMRAGRLEEVREFYGNVDGNKVVDGWDNVRNRAATSDSSHLWHWHLTIDRRHCANKPLMERILAIVLGEDDDMPLSGDADRKFLQSALHGMPIGRSGVWLGAVLDGLRSAPDKLDAILNAVLGDADAERITAEIRAQGEQTRAALLAKLTEIAPTLAQEVADRLGPEAAASEIGEALARELAEMLNPAPAQQG